MVQEVERFGAELEITFRTGLELFRQHRVDVVVAGRPRDTDRTVAPRAPRRSRERVDVEPVVDVLIRWDRISDTVRSLVAARALQRWCLTIDDGDREPRSRLQDPAEPPAAEDRVDERGRVAPPPAPLSERNFVIGGEDEVVPCVEERRTIVPLRLVRVHPV